MCFGVKIWNFVFFGVKNLELVCFLVSAKNGAGVSKMTNIRYGGQVHIVESTRIEPFSPRIM